jgi:hypothetical protein
MATTFQYISPDTSAYSGNVPNSAGKISIGSLSDGVMTNIDHSIISVSVEYSMSQASQLSFDVIEVMNTDYSKVSEAEKTYPRVLEFAENNYFQIGRDVIYETTTLNEIGSTNNSGINLIKQKQLFEISSLTFSQGPGGSPTWQVKCFPKAIQQMKRDRNPGTVKGTGSTFVKNAAKKYGLKYFGEETSKKQTVTKASGDKQADSLWDVLGRLATDAKFVIFEVDGYLIFGSEKFILHKWGIDSGDTIRTWNNKEKKFKTKGIKYIPLQYPAVGKGTPGYFFAMSYPTINVSTNDPRYGDGSIVVDRQNGTQIRPGMTAYVGNVPSLNGYYLIDSVSFSDRTPDPITVNFRKPTLEPTKEKELPIGLRFLQTDAERPIATRVTNKNGNKAKPPAVNGAYFPLPTELTEYNFSSTYPRMKSGLISVGNIPLYSRPVLTVNGEGKTTYLEAIFQKPDLTINNNGFKPGNTVVLINSIWTYGGFAVQLTKAEATAKYLSDGLFIAKLDSIKNAEKYGEFIVRQQIEILRIRFPEIDYYNGGVYSNTPGLT